MGLDDKAGNEAQEAMGKVKEGAGKVTGDDQLKSQGQKDQSMSKMKQVGEKIKDVFKK